MKQRQIILGALAGLMVLLVLMDQAGVFASDTETNSSNLEQTYRDQVQTLAKTQQIIAQQTQWQQAYDHLTRDWTTLRKRMIEAPNEDLASARLLNAIKTLFADMDLQVQNSNATPVQVPLDDEPVRVVGQVLNFQAQNPDRVYELIDRIEHLDDLIIVNAQVRLSGPARRLGNNIQVSIQVQALAWIQ